MRKQDVPEMLYSRHLIVAIDPHPGFSCERLEEIAALLSDYVAGFKLGWPAILTCGIDVCEKVKRVAGDKIVLLDLKLADIGYVMKSILSFMHGFDAVIAHAFVGVEGALDEVKKFLEKRGVKLVLVYSMTHPGALSTFDKCLDAIDLVVKRINPWALIVPATRPEVIRRARQKHPDKVLMAPGIGVQGAKPGSAICAGADYEIIGRSIVLARNPLEALVRITREASTLIEHCKT